MLMLCEFETAITKSAYHQLLYKFIFPFKQKYEIT